MNHKIKTDINQLRQTLGPLNLKLVFNLLRDIYNTTDGSPGALADAVYYLGPSIERPNEGQV
jgi:hypothetical protein